VTPIPRHLVINTGTGFEAVSRGFLKPLPHRVRLQRNGERFSWVMFIQPGWTTIQEPIPLGHSELIDEWVASKGDKEDMIGSNSFFGKPYGEHIVKVNAMIYKKKPVDALH